MYYVYCIYLLFCLLFLFIKFGGYILFHCCFFRLTLSTYSLLLFVHCIFLFVLNCLLTTNHVRQIEIIQHGWGLFPMVVLLAKRCMILLYKLRHGLFFWNSAKFDIFGASVYCFFKFSGLAMQFRQGIQGYMDPWLYAHPVDSK